MTDHADIRVEKVDSTTYQVTVESAKTTEHEVHLDPVDYEKLSGGDVPPEQLIETSFEFLLEREPNTAILPFFELPQISNFFPEYDDEIRSMLD